MCVVLLHAHTRSVQFWAYQHILVISIEDITFYLSNFIANSLSVSVAFIFAEDCSHHFQQSLPFYVMSVGVSISICTNVEREQSVNFIAKTYAKRILRINRIIFWQSDADCQMYTQYTHTHRDTHRERETL